MCISVRNSRRGTERRGSRRLALAAAAASLVLTLAGCAVGPDFLSPDAPAVTHYTGGADPLATEIADGTAQTFSSGTDLPVDWWRLFNCPTLDDVVRQGIAGSPSIEAAEATLRQSEDTLRAGYGVFYPQIDSGFSAQRQRSTSVKPGETGPGSIFNLFTLSATVSYALDVFGGERRAVEALGAEVDFQKNTARAAYLTLSSNIVNAIIAMAAYDAELQATQEIIGLQRKQVRLGEIQAKAGTMAYANVLILQGQLDSTESALPALRQKLSQTEHLLATLTGHLAADWRPPKVGFAELSLPRELPISLPSALVRQRPDILTAEASLHAASAGIGVATAALFPSLTLDGVFGFSNSSPGALLAASGQFWSVGAGVTQPIFHGGSLWFQRKAAIDAYDASTARYRLTVLVAFQQVADTLRAIEYDAEMLAADERSLHTATRALQLVQANYASGIATYTDVLIADALYHQARIGDIQARATRYQDTVALFVALGGGWWNDTDKADLAAKR